MNHVKAIRNNDEYQCSHCGKSWDIHEEAPDCKMTLIQSITPLTKQVDYFGIILSVPVWVTHIATDFDGDVYIYRNKPVDKTDCWMPSSDNDRLYKIIATVDLNGLDWKETLRSC